MGIIWSKIFPPKEDNSAAVKKQAEGASNPMYSLASLVSSNSTLGRGKLSAYCLGRDLNSRQITKNTIKEYIKYTYQMSDRDRNAIRNV